MPDGSAAAKLLRICKVRGADEGATAYAGFINHPECRTFMGARQLRLHPQTFIVNPFKFSIGSSSDDLHAFNLVS